jgi:hypothetical protein
MPMKIAYYYPKPCLCDLGEGTVWFRTTKEYNKDWIKFAFRCTLVFYSKEEDASLGQIHLKTIHFGFKTLLLEQKMTKVLWDGTIWHNSRTHSKIETSEETSVTDRAFPSFWIGHLVSGANGWLRLRLVNRRDYAFHRSIKEDLPLSWNEAGCSETRTCNVTLSYLAKIQNIIVHDLLPSNNVVIEAMMITTIWYSLKMAARTALKFKYLCKYTRGFHELIIENKMVADW